MEPHHGKQVLNWDVKQTQVVVFFVKCVEMCKQLCGAPSFMSTKEVRCCDSWDPPSCIFPFLFFSFIFKSRDELSSRQPHVPTADGNNKFVVFMCDKRKTQSQGFKRAHKRALSSGRRLIKFCGPTLHAARPQISLISPDVCPASLARLEIAPFVFLLSVFSPPFTVGTQDKEKKKQEPLKNSRNDRIQIIRVLMSRFCLQPRDE